MSKSVLIITPHDEPGDVYTREMRCQEKIEILGTRKPPLTPALIAALLERNEIPFMAIEGLPADRACAFMREKSFTPDIIVFPTCTPTIQKDMVFIELLKQKTGAVTAAFGPHTSGIPRETLDQFSALDICIVGEPEETVIEIASEGKPPGGIAGIAYRGQGGAAVENPKRGGVEDLDSLPMPAWKHFDLSSYRVPLFGKKFLTLEVSRGCPYQCGFCVVPLTHGNRVREKSAARIVEEIKFMKKQYGVSFFYLWGDTAVLRTSSADELCSRIISERLDIEWISNTRPEAVKDARFAEKLRLSGCRMLSMGAESGDSEVLETMKKNLDVGALARSVRLLKGARIRTFVFFIFGYPGENRGTMEKTVRLALDLDPDYANFYPAVPYPGTPLWNYCVKNELLLSNDWRKVDFSDYILRAPGLPPEDVISMVRAARRRFYFRPKYMLKTLRDFTSPAWAFELIKASPKYLRV